MIIFWVSQSQNHIIENAKQCTTSILRRQNLSQKASKLNILTLVGFKETYLLTIEVIIASAFFLDKLREMI